jgi:hypothetical protein
MTSEVVVMNRLGIALASDSAATIDGGGSPKVYHADKLFMLSQRQPIGVMVYNNSSLLGIPWETIIKMYRQKHGAVNFDTLEEYAEHFIHWLDDNEYLFPLEEQERHYFNLVDSLFKKINKEIFKEIIGFVRSGDEDDEKALYKRVANDVILKWLHNWRSKDDVSCFDTKTGTSLAGTYSGDINKLVETHFNRFQIDRDTVNALYELAGLIVSKDEILTYSLSGVVIAGFGDKEYFPVMKAYELGEVYFGKLKYRCVSTEYISSDNPSVVKPFAQSDMVFAFLHGISPAFEEKLIKEIPELVKGLGCSATDVPATQTIIDWLDEYRKQKHLNPILQGIEYLPKKELAHVAASLVSLSSFQKRMAMDQEETVGGPIDVAVISKGDGFVWVERKHYFPRELNHHFFRNYGITDANQKGDGNGDTEG